MTTERPVTVLVVDDDEGFQEFAKGHLGGTVNVVGQASDGEEAVKLARELRPEVVLIDIDIPVVDGLTATQQIKAACPEAKVVLLTSHDEDAYLSATGKSGADALLPKRKARTEMLSVVRRLVGRFVRHASVPSAE